MNNAIRTITNHATGPSTTEHTAPVSAGANRAPLPATSDAADPHHAAGPVAQHAAPVAAVGAHDAGARVGCVALGSVEGGVRHVGCEVRVGLFDVLQFGQLAEELAEDVGDGAGVAEHGAWAEGAEGVAEDEGGDGGLEGVSLRCWMGKGKGDAYLDTSDLVLDEAYHEGVRHGAVLDFLPHLR